MLHHVILIDMESIVDTGARKCQASPCGMMSFRKELTGAAISTPRDQDLRDLMNAPEVLHQADVLNLMAGTDMVPIDRGHCRHCHQQVAIGEIVTGTMIPEEMHRLLPMAAVSGTCLWGCHHTRRSDGGIPQIIGMRTGQSLVRLYSCI